jgi:hypothetical protein
MSILFISCSQSDEVCEKGHSFGEWTITIDSTCTEEGSQKRTCSECGFIEKASIPANGHDYNVGDVIKEPTCIEVGTKTYICTVCNVAKTEEIPAKGHSYDAGIITKEATCTEEGIKSFTCSICSMIKNDSILAAGHNYDGIKCSVCGKYSMTLSSIGTENIDVDGLILTLNTFTHSESNGYNIYSINYSLRNTTYGSEKGPGVFKIIYKTSDGSYDSKFQTGAFNNLYYGDVLTRSYSWKLTSDKTFIVLEYMADSQMSSYIFSDTPSDKLLNWITE